MSAPQQAPASFRFLDLPPEVRDIVYRFAFTPHEPVNLLQLDRPDCSLLLACQLIRREAEFPIFRRDSRPYWRSDRYWRDTRFYLDADLTVAIGMLRVYQQVAARQIRLSSLTRLQLRSTQRERIFTFQHGVWTCTGQCCQQLPLTWDAFTHHAHNVIALPRSAPLPAILGTGFVRSIRYVGPNPLPSYAPTLSIGPAGDRLRVAELNWDVAVNDTVAFQASAGSWDGLMFRELTGIWAWYES